MSVRSFFILVKAVEELYPQGSISLEHPISKGYFCKLHIDRTIGLDDVQRIKQKNAGNHRGRYSLHTH